MQCQACGAELPPESQFCSQCGARSGEAGGGSPSPTPTAAERFHDAGPRQDEGDAEHDLWSGGYSGKAMVGNWLLAIVASVALIVVCFLLPPLTIAAMVVIPLIWAVMLLILAYRKLSVHYLLTNQRFVHRTGILKRVTDRIEVIDIDDVSFEQGIVQRMFGVGTIKISSSDRTHPELALYGIDDVRQVADTIDDVRRKERRQRGLHIETI